MARTRTQGPDVLETSPVFVLPREAAEEFDLYDAFGVSEVYIQISSTDQENGTEVWIHSTTRLTCLRIKPEDLQELSVAVPMSGLHFADCMWTA